MIAPPGALIARLDTMIARLGTMIALHREKAVPHPDWEASFPVDDSLMGNTGRRSLKSTSNRFPADIPGAFWYLSVASSHKRFLRLWAAWSSPAAARMMAPLNSPVLIRLSTAAESRSSCQ